MPTVSVQLSIFLNSLPPPPPCVQTVGPSQWGFKWTQTLLFVRLARAESNRLADCATVISRSN